MIIGIGTDIAEVKRFKDKEELHNKFLTEEDKKYIGRFRHSTERIAGFWAAKEALVKALDDKTIPFDEISILHTENGKPYFDFTPPRGKIHLSISHEKEYAVAFVVWEE